MRATIENLSAIEDETALKALVLEFMEHELAQMYDVSGLRLDAAPMVSATFDNIANYLPPRGRLLVAREETGAPIGCVFVKMIRTDTAEIKRLYVKSSARGQGLGRRLMERALDEVRTMGAAQILLDTGVYDTAAHALYGKLGFRKIDSYPEGESDPELHPYLVFMQLDL